MQIAAEEARDLLLVYYAGQGHFHRDGKSLRLASGAGFRSGQHRRHDGTS
ncbi:hypothetical protein ACFV30_19820 [Streptomyces sp. NPDC059752]